MTPDDASPKTGKEEDGKQARTKPEIRRSRFPGWIWGIPVAALAVVAWLGVRALSHRGVEINVEFDDATGMKADETFVVLHGVKVGEVTQIALTENGDAVDATIKMDESVGKYLRTGTQFWKKGSGGFQGLSSLKSLIAGPTIVVQPGGGEPARRFEALSHPPAFDGPHGPLVSYAVNFDGDVGSISAGAPVALRGFTVGGVEKATLRYDDKTGAITTPVTIVLDPERFGVPLPAKATPADARPAMNAALKKLIANGLRARLKQDPPFIGSYKVTLSLEHNAPAAALGGGDVPLIPVAPGGGLQSFVGKLDELPIVSIGENVRHITEEVDKVASSPALDESVEHLNDTLAELDKTIQKTGPKLDELITSLRRTANEIDDTVANADRVLGGPLSQDDSVRASMRELTRAARAIHSLADYLDRHPEALIKGKSGD